jgi:hypothetical protein
MRTLVIDLPAAAYPPDLRASSGLASVLLIIHVLLIITSFPIVALPQCSGDSMTSPRRPELHLVLGWPTTSAVTRPFRRNEEMTVYTASSVTITVPIQELSLRISQADLPCANRLHHHRAPGDRTDCEIITKQPGESQTRMISFPEQWSFVKWRVRRDFEGNHSEKQDILVCPEATRREEVESDRAEFILQCLNARRDCLKNELR